MPAGDTREELIKMYPIVFDMCAEKGYNMTGRDHIIAWDTKRGGVNCIRLRKRNIILHIYNKGVL